MIFNIDIFCEMVNARKLISSFFLGFCFLVSQAQVAETAAGGNATGSGGTVSYSLGQVDYIGTSNANGSVNQGVQQPYELFTVSLHESEKDFSLLVFPNPAIDNLTIKNDQLNNEYLSYELYDVNCKLIEKKEISGKSTTISMLDLVSGPFFLIVIKNNSELKTFKIIKK